LNFRVSRFNPNDICLHRSRGGSGVIEVLIVVATLALLVVVALSGILGWRSYPRGARITCVNNLKQVGLAARIWANDYGDVFPWAAPISSNGVKELALSGDVAALFRSMSNECGSPKILKCPSDLKRTKESDWAKLKNSNISYFIGLDSDETKPQIILSGDRNISGGVLTSNRIVDVRATNILVWGADIHAHQGNIGLGDGSAMQLNNPGLRRQTLLQSTNLSVVRFAFP
jgi:hypothetical protein